MGLENRLQVAATANRRGLLVGLTISEIMMILLFALLLLFGTLLLEQDKAKARIAELEKALVGAQNTASTALAVLGPLKDVLAQYGALPSDIDDILTELAAVQEAQAELKSLQDGDSTLAARQVPPDNVERKQIAAAIEAKRNDLSNAQSKLELTKRKLLDTAKQKAQAAKLAQALTQYGISPDF